MTLLDEASEWACSLRVAGIPEDVRTLAVALLTSDLGALLASLQHPAAGRVMRRWNTAPQRAAALTLMLDWDESSFAGHFGHSVALPSLLLGAEAGADGATLMLAMVAGAEVAARVTAAVTLGRARGQAAAHTHLAGGVVVAGLLAGLNPGQLTAALGLALGQPSEVVLPAFMGSDAKFAVAAGPLGLACSAVTAAAAGGIGLADALERPGGVLERLAEVPLPHALSAYGDRWHLRTLSFKRFPGCAYISAAVEGAAGIGPLELDEVEAVEIGSSIFTIAMEAESAPFLAGARTPLPALNFSAGYGVAAALEGGTLRPQDFAEPALARPRRWEVAGRVKLRHDPGLSLNALAATAPLGMALAWAGERARPYLEARGAAGELAGRVLAAAAVNLDDPQFLAPTKRIGANIVVKLRDGRRLESGRGAAAGSCQESAEERLGLVQEKLRSVGGDPELGEAAAELARLDADGVRRLAAALRDRLEV